MQRVNEEKRVIEQMIRLYSQKKEGNHTLCAQWQELLNYAHFRQSHCKYGNNKPTCQKCPIHCYRSDMRLRIKAVMSWAGPRMLLYHPIAAVKHLIRELF